MAQKITLKGITWNHTRGFLPMVATAQRFQELHPEVEISWQKRSLQEFGDAPADMLAERFDLMVIDHPFTGFAAEKDIFIPFDELLSREFLNNQAANSVGSSHTSYKYFGKQWALAIDAATPISTARIDLLEKHGESIPQSWEELIALARKGLVAVPAIAIDSMMNHYMFCVALGEEPAKLHTDKLVSDEINRAALEHLKELVSVCAPECLLRNPIQTAKHMTQTDEVAYCPFAYGYSNYSRPGYARRVLTAGGLVTLGNGTRLRSTLGGTGLAISHRCQQVAVAAEYARFVASPEVQAGLYYESGGQPGHRAAWTSDAVNNASTSFFANTLATLDEAYLRPCYNGAIHLQDAGGPVIHSYLRGELSLQGAADELNRFYRESRLA